MRADKLTTASFAIIRAISFVTWTLFISLLLGFMLEPLRREAVTAAGGQIPEGFRDPTQLIPLGYMIFFLLFYSFYALLGDPSQEIKNERLDRWLVGLIMILPLILIMGLGYDNAYQILHPPFDLIATIIVVLSALAMTLSKSLINSI